MRLIIGTQPFDKKIYLRIEKDDATRILLVGERDENSVGNMGILISKDQQEKLTAWLTEKEK